MKKNTQWIQLKNVRLSIKKDCDGKCTCYVFTHQGQCVYFFRISKKLLAEKIVKLGFLD